MFPLNIKSWFNTDGDAAPTQSQMNTVAPRPVLNLNPAEPYLDVQFVERFTEAGGQFLYAETLEEITAQIAQLAEHFNWQYLYVSDPILQNLVPQDWRCNHFEQADAIITCNAGLVAKNGSVLLNPQQGGSRVHPDYPKNQVIVAQLNHIFFDVANAYQAYQRQYPDQPPFVLPMPQADVLSDFKTEGIALDAEGSLNNFLVLCDQSFQ